jgi:ubiquinone/menaquinone biosynthesis C-methylase UbiE
VPHAITRHSPTGTELAAPILPWVQPDQARDARSPGYVDAASLGSMAEFADAIKRRAMALLDPRPGQRLLDAGCGPGLDTAALAAVAGPRGCVVGVDHDPRMIEAARAQAGAEKGARARHLVGDGAHLPFADGWFDACRCERVLQHVAHPAAMLSELVRVTRPGGTVLALDTDWASLSIDCQDVALERHITRQVADTFASGYAGRQLPRLMRDAGLAITAVDVCAVQWNDLECFRRTSFPASRVAPALLASGRVSACDWNRFFASVQPSGDPAFFASATIVLAAGRKPRLAGGAEGTPPRATSSTSQEVV